MKKLNSNGITLIALIITVIILLILAGLAVTTLTEGGILKKSEQAGLQTKLKEIEELGQISFMTRKIEEVTQGEEATLAGVISDLKANGYTIAQKVNDGSMVEEIILSNKEIIMGKNAEQILSYTFTYKEQKAQYFVEVQANYYEIRLEKGKILVDTKKVDLDNIKKENSIIVKSSKEDLLEIQLLENNEISLKSNTILGETMLTVREENSGKEENCIVKVKIPATNLTVTPTNTVVVRGKTAKITASVMPRDTTDEILWNSSDINVATVASDGMVTGIKDGTAIITAKCGEQLAACSVTVAEQGSAATIARNRYGKVVTNYTMMSKTWEIFYANTNNIYLITRECVEDPIYRKKTLIDTVSAGTYSEGSSMLSNKNRFPAAEEWLYVWNKSNCTSNYPNMQATLFMLDSQNVWNNAYRNATYADYAIGSPTAELFTASYNGNINWSPPYGAKDIGYHFGGSQHGYSVSGQLYHGEDYWLAGPYASPERGRREVMANKGNSCYGWGLYDSSVGKGFRPVVRLKANVILETSDEGETYKMKLKN